MLHAATAMNNTSRRCLMLASEVGSSSSHSRGLMESIADRSCSRISRNAHLVFLA